MNFKHMVASIFNKSATFRAINYRRKIEKCHKTNVKKHVKDKKAPIYYIISYSDPQSSGWTVWERVVLYGCIYAEDHNMIPVVDMQNTSNIYLEKEEIGKANAWEKYYCQPGGVSLKDALVSENYVIGDASYEWFVYVRMRKPKKLSDEKYLRKKYQQYIKLLPTVEKICEERLDKIVSKHDENVRLLGICLRGTDYKKYHHSVQPEVETIVREAEEIYKKYNCDYYFLATEDYNIFKCLSEKLPKEKVIVYNAGNIKDADGELVGKTIRSKISAREAALDYITTLYILDKCCCLIGGLCGATIVAKYRKSPPYEYIDIKDLNKHY